MNQNVCDVIITTKNRPDSLRRSLRGLLGQTHEDFGLIVVDDCSDRPMAEVVNDPEFASLRRTVVTLEQPSGPAAGRNAGVARSEATYIIFLDDDVVPDPRFIEVHLKAVMAADATTGPIVSCGPFVQPDDWENPTPWNLWEARLAQREADALVSGKYPTTWRQFHTGNNCLPRQMFCDVGGFDERFKRAEDDEFGLRLFNQGCSFVFLPEAVGLHYSNRSLEAWLLTARSYAYFDIMIDRLHPERGHLKRKKFELRFQRSLPLILVRGVLRGRRSKQMGIKAFVGLAQFLHRRNRTWLALAALSFAYDLSYVQSLNDAEKGRSEFDRAPNGDAARAIPAR